MASSLNLSISSFLTLACSSRALPLSEGDSEIIYWFPLLMYFCTSSSSFSILTRSGSWSLERNWIDLSLFRIPAFLYNTLLEFLMMSASLKGGFLEVVDTSCNAYLSREPLRSCSLWRAVSSANKAWDRGWERLKLYSFWCIKYISTESLLYISRPRSAAEWMCETCCWRLDSRADCLLVSTLGSRGLESEVVKILLSCICLARCSYLSW